MKVLAIFISIFTATVAMAQQSGSYEQLIQKESQLIGQQDSLQQLIDRNRYLISTESRSAGKYNKEILILEGELFDVRDQLGIITTDKNMMEEKLVLERMNSQRQEDASSLFSAQYFMENVSDADKKIMAQITSVTATVDAVAKREAALYGELSMQLEGLKDVNSKAEADSLMELARAAQLRIAALDDSVRLVCEPIFDKKIEVYSVLLDMRNVSMDLLDQLGQKSRDVRSVEYEAEAIYQNPATAMFPRKLVLASEYESALAEQLGLGDLAAKITAAAKMIDRSSYDLDYMEVPAWNFVDYLPLTIGGKVHSAKDPVGELDVASVGDMYKIELSHYVKEQTNYAVFRRIYPVQKLLDDDDEDGVTYFAGTYRTQAEAEEALARVKKVGFSKASIACWVDGRRVGEAVDAVSGTSSDGGEAMYRVEFANLTAGVKDIISECADDKELARSVDSKGVGVFTLGVFSDKAEADEVALKIDGAKVVELR